MTAFTLSTINFIMLAISLVLASIAIYYLRKVLKEDNAKIVAETKRQLKEEHTGLEELKSDAAFRSFLDKEKALTEWFKAHAEMNQELKKAINAQDNQMIDYFRGMIKKHNERKPK